MAHWLTLTVGAGKDRLGWKIANAGLYAPSPQIDSVARARRGARDGARAVNIGWIGGLLLALALIAGPVVGTAQAQSAAEVAFWNRVRDSTSADELKAYLEAYPNGAFAEMARARLKQLAPISLRPQMPSASGDALTDATVIREVQERLYNLNYEIGILNGQMTQETRNAIRQWQTNVNHEPTGELTEEELSQLRNARLPTTWGALAYAARGASAVVWNRPSRQEAVSAALADCHARAPRQTARSSPPPRRAAVLWASTWARYTAPRTGVPTLSCARRSGRRWTLP